MSSRAAYVLALAFLAVGGIGWWWSGQVLWVLVVFCGLAILIEDWIKGGKR